METNQDYKDGWNDCRSYAGEDSPRSVDYHEGFAACLVAYVDGLKTGTGWRNIKKWF